MSVHKGSQETYDYIAKWVSPEFFHSVNDRWDRMGFLGAFGDFVLSCTGGDIVEIGCGESSIYLSHLARKYSRRIYHCDIAPDKILNPLTVDGYMNKDRGIFHMGSSDKMFEEYPLRDIALGFIDGDHNYAQAKKDFDNLMAVLVDNGYILLHDTYPPSEEYIDENHCGDVYKLRQEIEKDNRYDCITLTRGTAMGVGLTIVRKKPKELKPYNE